ncbi:MAG: recombinase RecA [Bacillota bacterium]
MAKIKEENIGKEAALTRALAEIERKFGRGSLMRLGEKGAAVSVEVVSSGILPLDVAAGVGGIPCGRIVEIYGPESSGKTTVALHVIAEVQKNGGLAAFIDAEHALDPLYARKLGVKIDDLYISQPDSGEQALEIADTLINSGAIDVIVIDSVAALVPRAEIDGEMGDSHVGLQARLMSQAMRKMTATAGKTRTLVVFINQLREKVGVIYGNPEVTTGGRALKFYSSLRLEVVKAQEIRNNMEVVGNRVKIKITKNKVAPPFKVAETELYYGEGFSREIALMDLGEQCGVLEKSGAWYSFGGTRLGQGRENVRQFLKDHPEISAGIEGKIRESLFPPGVVNLKKHEGAVI